MKNEALQALVTSIRRRSGGADLTRKQIHAEVILDPAFAAASLSDVNWACSKVGKAIGNELAKQKDMETDPERPLQEKKGKRRTERQPLGSFREAAPVGMERTHKVTEPMAGEPPSDFLKRSLAEQIEMLVALQPHSDEGPVTTRVGMPAVYNPILLDELGVSAASHLPTELSPRQLLALLPTLSATVHPVAVGEWREIVVPRGTTPDIYLWAGFMSAKVLQPSSCPSKVRAKLRPDTGLVLEVVTRIVGEGKVEMHSKGVHEYDEYLECKTLQELDAWREAKRLDAFERIFELVRLGAR